MPFSIEFVDLECSREPLQKAFGFKGARFTEKWLSRVTLRAGDLIARAEAGLATLWSDADVFRAHTETGGNLLSLCVLEWALQKARDNRYENPRHLLETLLEPAHAYAQSLTQRRNLRKTFTLNALVGLDNAAWQLQARLKNATDFDAMLQSAPGVLADGVLPARQPALACVPLVSYEVSPDEVRALVEQGHFLLKIKLGNGDEPQRMLQNDTARLREIHRAVGEMPTPHTQDGRIRYYLDANGRYPDKALLQQLLESTRAGKMFDQIALLEEPFPEDVEIDVSDLGVMVAADESLHDPANVAARAALGYRALALKPAGKTLSMTLEMLAAAQRLGLHCFVADSSCTPAMLDWNRNVAARLPALPGFKIGILESNGAQHYQNWAAMLAAHPLSHHRWLHAEQGIFHLDETFFQTGFPLQPVD